MEFLDGIEYGGDMLDRMLVIAGHGYEFHINLHVSDKACTELREYLKALVWADCYRA